MKVAPVIAKDDPNEFLLRQDLLADFEERLANLAAVAAELKVPAPRYERIGTEVHRKAWEVAYSEVSQGTIEVAYEHIRLIEEPLRLPGGWDFVAVIDHDPAGNIIRRGPGQDSDLEAFRHAEPTCDYCGTERSRKQTIVCRDENGDLKRVGGSCVKKVLGGLPSLNSTLWNYWAEYCRVDDWYDEDASAVGGYGSYWSTPTVLAYAVACIRTFGYGNGQTNYPTKQRVKRLLNPAGADDYDTAWMKTVSVSIADYAEAKTVSDWLRNLDVAEEFETNMIIACGRQAVDPKNLGIVCYAPEAYRRAQADQRERELLAKVEALPRTSVVIGRQVITGTVTRAYTKDTDYGTQHKAIIKDDRGFTVCGTAPLYGLEPGDRLTFTATVEPSDGDITFGFYKRPAKAELLETAGAA